tara:strand:+ start:305 stop:1264 length:960 start_codon:yes stop_codon:yes gene_type:complete
MSILVTGGAGYIGTHIVDMLLQSGCTPIVVDNFSNSYVENINTSVEYYNYDISNIVNLEKIFKKHRIEAVIHLAALKNVEESNVKQELYFKNNIVGSINIISLVMKYSIEKFIFSSSASVYGDPERIPIDEQHRTNPINYYGLTKLYIDNYLDLLNKQNRINFISFRYFNAAGYSLDNFREKKSHNLIPLVMKNILEAKKLFKVYGNDYNTHDGTCIRDYIHASDIALAHIKALKYLDKNKSNIFNLSCNKPYSVLDIINISEKISKKNLNYTFSDRRLGDPATLISNYNKAKLKLNWEPLHSIDEIILSAWKYYRNVV